MGATALTHASFFSGGGGTDLGLEAAGWRTVSLSEIDPYACAVLARRWPDISNLGDITAIEDRGGEAWAGATLWSGGFPCQDLSVAGKRRGMHHDGELTRSGLAHVFLDLVRRHAPPWVLLENVPGLLSSNGGRDMAALLDILADLGYGVAWDILDARYFGVPQRRRRVFLLATRDPGGRAGAERAAAVLSVAKGGAGHPPTGIEAGPGVAERAALGVDIAGESHGVAADGATSTRTIQSAFGHHGWTLGAQDIDGGLLQLANGLRASDGHHGHGSPRGDGSDTLISTPTHARRMRAADELLRRLDDRAGVELAPTLLAPKGGSRTTDLNLPLAFVKHTRGGINHTHGHESWGLGELAGTLDSIGQSPRTATAIVGESPASGADDLLPVGLDSHRYRVCGNGVVANVAEVIGIALRQELERGEVR